VITGFNTDVEHDGVVYHVQTEDKGLDTPVILSLVYSGGAILASKRSPYQDLIAEGFTDEALAERLKRQHKLICAAIHGGRINDLKRMSGRSTGPINPEIHVYEVLADEVSTEPVTERDEEGASKRMSGTGPLDPDIQVYEVLADEVSTEPVIERDEEGTSDTQRELELRVAEPVEADQVTSEAEYPEEATEEGLVLTLLNDQEFRSGDEPTLSVLVSNRSGQDEKPLNNVSVSIKILGTTFRPLIYSLKTQKDGTASVSTQIPHFTSGRAAVLVRAVVKGKAAELRRVIHPGR